MILLAAGLLAGCAAPPEREAVRTAGTVPPHWSAPAAAEGAVTPWLRSFGDPGLSGLVHAALSGNFNLKAVAARIDQARALARIEGAARQPQVELAPGYQHMGLAEASVPVYGDYWELPVNLSWELDLWGRIRSAQQAVEAEVEAARSDLDGAVLSLAARTVQTCFELAEARQQVQVVEQSIAERRTLVDLVKSRFTLGLTGGLDLSLAATDLSDAEAQLAEARDRAQRTARQLDALLGRYPAGATPRCAGLPEPPPPLPAGLPSDLLARRPDIVAGFARLRALDLRLSSAEKALLPRVTLNAAVGMSGAAAADLVDPRSAAWNLALGLIQPLFTGGRLSAEIDLAAARVEEETQRYRDTVLNAFRQVEETLAAERWLLDRERALAETLRRTETSRKLAIHAYRNGTVEILTLLDSYRSTLNARSASLAARRQVLQNRVGLYLALGGPA
jgi:multidrug efflux system outer membrane protein